MAPLNEEIFALELFTLSTGGETGSIKISFGTIQRKEDGYTGRVIVSGDFTSVDCSGYGVDPIQCLFTMIHIALAQVQHIERIGNRVFLSHERTEDYEYTSDIWVEMAKTLCTG